MPSDNYRRSSLDMRFSSLQVGWLFKLVRFLFVGTLLMASISPSWALAQSMDDSWDEPLNLSHSGVATNPSIIVDSEGVVRAVWQDENADFVSTRLDGDQWSTPQTTDLNRMFRMPDPSESPAAAPLTIFSRPNPVFITGPGPFIFAFWISPQGKLFTSKVLNLNFEHVAAWDNGSVIASDVASFTVAVDARGEWHLAYFHTAEAPRFPAGIYYTRSRNGGWSSAVPVLLYESPYLRSLAADEANLNLVTGGTADAPLVYIVWDNRPRKQVFLMQSADGGANWEQPTLVAGPAPDSKSADPFNIHVGANQNSVVLVWQTGGATNGLLPGCSHMYQSSKDAGATWSDPQLMSEEGVCAQSNEFVTGWAGSPGSLLYFLTEAKSQVFLTAWDGLRWSQPQEQPILSGFEEPEIFTDVIYGCHQASLIGERLYIIGCDQGDGGDVWITSRGMTSDASWFQAPAWSQLSPVSSDRLDMEAVELVTTEDDSIHAVLNQHRDPFIYYMYWNGDAWSSITPVLKMPDGEAGLPAIAAGPGNELFLIAPNNMGSLYFSRATSGNASTESRWSTPTQLETGHDGEIGSVDVAWDTDGTIYVAYSVPVNDERGIYLVQSNDHGASWSEPLQVFNGAAAGFDLVGAPSLLKSENGFLHIIWKQQSIQGDGVPQPVSLYYSRSEDGGKAFSDGERLVDEPVTWQEIVADDKGNLHLLWQSQETLTTVWDQVSLDGGNSWQFPQGLPVDGKIAVATRDPVGRLHFLGAGSGSLGHWLWDGSHWQSEIPLKWSSAQQLDGPVELLSAAVNKQGKMVAVMAVRTSTDYGAEKRLLYSSRTLELPTEPTEIQDPPTPTASLPTLTPATSTPEPSSTLAGVANSEPTNSESQADPNETNDRRSPFTMALIPVVLLLLIVLGVVIQRVARSQDR